MLIRRGTAVAALALLAGFGPSACGVAGPAPDRQQAQGAREADKPKPPEVTQPHLVLRLGERRLYVVDGDPAAPLASFRIAIGKEGWETPVGQFQVEEMIEHPDFVKIDDVDPMRIIKRIPPGATNPLGERWIGFAHGEGWTVGIHGTPNPELLGRAVSHGCIRMRNADVIRVYGHVQLGTTVIVEH